MKLLIAFSFAALLILEMAARQFAVKSSAGDPNQDDRDNRPLFSFGVISDVQYADKAPYGERNYRSSLVKLKEALETFSSNSINFIVNMGDLIDEGYESYKPVLNILNSSEFKCYHLTGNHDYSVDPRYLTRLPVFTESREGYYSIIYFDYRIIFVNGNEISTYAAPNSSLRREAEKYIADLKAAGEMNAIEWNGGVGDVQLEWIKDQLNEAVDNKERVIMICHFPIAPENIHNLLNYKSLIKLISNYPNIVAWFSGHNHEGNYYTANKVHYVTFKGMVETRRSNSFAIVDIYKNRIVIKGFGREQSRILDL